MYWDLDIPETCSYTVHDKVDEPFIVANCVTGNWIIQNIIYDFECDEWINCNGFLICGECEHNYQGGYNYKKEQSIYYNETNIVIHGDYWKLCHYCYIIVNGFDVGMLCNCPSNREYLNVTSITVFNGYEVNCTNCYGFLYQLDHGEINCPQIDSKVIHYSQFSYVNTPIFAIPTIHGRYANKHDSEFEYNAECGYCYLNNNIQLVCNCGIAVGSSSSLDITNCKNVTTHNSNLVCAEYFDNNFNGWIVISSVLIAILLLVLISFVVMCIKYYKFKKNVTFNDNSFEQL